MLYATVSSIEQENLILEGAVQRETPKNLKKDSEGRDAKCQDLCIRKCTDLDLTIGGRGIKKIKRIGKAAIFDTK